MSEAQAVTGGEVEMADTGADDCQEQHALTSNGQPTQNGKNALKSKSADKYEKEPKINKKSSCCDKLRSSQNFVIFVIFIAMLIDSLLVTVMEPLLPDIVKDVMGGHCEESGKDISNITNLNNSVPYALNGGNTPLDLPSNVSKCVSSEDESYEKYGFYIGLLAAAKPAPEIIFNLIIGHVVDRYGQRFLMVLGCFINAAVTIGFAFVKIYGVLVAIRVIQAFASSLTIISAMALFATSFPNEEDLARAAGIASSGLALGSIIGWPLSTFTYQFISIYAPFLILAGLCLTDAVFRLMIPGKDTRTDLSEQLKPGKFMKTLFTDVDIVIVLITVFLYCYSLSFFSALGPAWMLDFYKAELWQIGTLWGVAVLYQIIIQVTAGVLGAKVEKWKFFCSGFVVYSLCFLIYPFTTVIWQGLGAEALGRMGHAFILGMVFPHFKQVTEKRMSMSYGARFGVFTAVYNAGLLSGPLIGGAFLNLVSFEWLCWGVSIVLMLYAAVFPIARFCRKSEPETVDVETADNQTQNQNGQNKFTGSSMIHSGTLC